VTKSCDEAKKSDFGKRTGKGGILCALLYDDKAKKGAIAAGTVAGAVIGAVAGAAVIGFGGKAGYDYLMAKNNPSGPVLNNPLYAHSPAAGNNQLYTGPSS